MIIRTRKVDLPHDVSRLRNDSVLFPSIPLSTFVNSRLTLRRGASRETRRIEAALRPPFDKLADEVGYDEITCPHSVHPDESRDLLRLVYVFKDTDFGRYRRVEVNNLLTPLFHACAGVCVS